MRYALVIYAVRVVGTRLDDFVPDATRFCPCHWRWRRGCRHQASIRTWIFAIARHKCWDAIKRRKSMIKAGWAEDNEHDLPDNAWSPDQLYEQPNFLARVKTSLSQLRSADREILGRTYITEMPRAEVARLLGIAETGGGLG